MKVKEFFQGREGESSRQVARRQNILKGGVLVVVLGLFFLLQSTLNKAQEKPPEPDKPTSVVLGSLVSSQEVWAARMEGVASSMQKKAEALEKVLSLYDQRFQALEEALLAKKGKESSSLPAVSKEGSLKGLSPSFPSYEGDKDMPVVSPGSFEVPAYGDGSLNASEVVSAGGLGNRPRSIMHLSSSGVPSGHRAPHYVVAGSYARAVLTSGVVVSTATATQSNPQPIVLRLSSAGFLPRGWRSPLKDAVLVGSCHGDLSSERALCRLHTLSFVETDGRTVEREVEGWIMGEDGSPGLRGKVVDKAGAVARQAFLSGILSGMSSFLKFEAQSSVYPVTPFGQTKGLNSKDALRGSLGQGTSNALEKLADFSIKRAESMQPVIVVNPGRVVDVVFKKGFNLNQETQTMKLRTVSSSRTE